jgi:predicted nucleotidyltransferase component of viral defense system
VTQPPKNVVASVLARLRNVAQEASLSFNDILQSYVIERFLARLARSPHADTVLLKGALMLRVWGVPRARPTMDIDLLRRGIGDQAALVRLVEQCAAIDDPSDGVIFEPTTISVESIRDATEYVGTRIRLQARLDKVRQTVQIDFGIGDAVHPEPQIIDYPVILTSPPVRLNAYPVEAAIAEKFQAMVHLDMQNSRMKDFYDIWILSRTLAFSGPALSQAIRSTFNRRQTSVPVIPPAALTAKFHSEPVHVRQWTAFVRRIGEPALANEFSRVVADLNEFLMPAAKAAATSVEYPVHWKPLGPWQPRRSSKI